ncbi:LiaF transmembrane domain-containing protein [Nubsella zeaxanthinifaciens]|uniref:LiaF transmembrane domain-containing protein n=1 Tax=Nubsella zeaxanthinifaciens TaxID=392412 RepID=UPI003D002FB9
MENTNHKEMVNRSGKVWAGLIIVAIGSLLLLRNVGLFIPSWTFSWSTWLIVIGLFVGARSNFKNSGWFVMVLIGSYFTLDEALGQYNIGDVAFPIMLLALGLFLIVKPKSTSHFGKRSWKRKYQGYKEFDQTTPLGETDDSKINDNNAEFNASDYISSVNVFGGSNQVIYSKNLKGGEVTAVFGGGDINLTQADFDGQIIIDVTAIFGGIKIVVPPTWQIKSEVTAILGGVDDKRTIYATAEQPTKQVIVRGVVLLGGVEFKSY